MRTAHCRWIPIAIASLAFGVSLYGQTESIAVNDPRPLQAAVLSLNKKYSIPITYEDPRYTFAGELRDVSRNEPPPGYLRDIAPTGGELQASYSLAPGAGQPTDFVTAVQALVDAQNATATGGRFVVVRGEKAIHVIPIEIRDKNGNWVTEKPVLDTPITLAIREGTGQQLLDAIVDALSKASGEKFWGAGGYAVGKDLMRYHGAVSATREPARDVLMRVLGEMGPRYTYVLDYDPSAPAWSIGVHLTAEPPEPAPQPAAPRPRDPTQPRPGDARRSN